MNLLEKNKLQWKKRTFLGCVVRVTILTLCVVFFDSYFQFDAHLGTVLGHSDDVITLQAIQTIVHSVTATKPTADSLRHNYLACK